MTNMSKNKGYLSLVLLFVMFFTMTGEVLAQAKVERTIYKVRVVNKNLEESKVSFELIVKNVEEENLSVKAFKDDLIVEDVEVSFKSETAAKKIVSISFPKSSKEEDYTVKFYLDDDEEVQKELDVTIEPTLKDNLESIELKVKSMKSSGGYNPLVIRGNNLDKDLKVKLLDENKKEIKLGKKEQKFTNTEAEYLLEIPENTEFYDKKYTVQVIFQDEILEETFIVQQKKISEEEIGVFLNNVFINEDANKITAGFNTDIINNRKNIEELKTNIKIKHIDGKIVNLESEDNIELDGKHLVINLKNPLSSTVAIFLQIREGSFRSEDNLYSKEVEKIILKESTPVYESLEIEEDIFPHTGGKVKLILKGKNLINSKGTKNKGTQAKLIKLDEGKAIDVDIKIEGEGDEQIITFNVPENNTKRTQSYAFSFSINGGMSYVDKTSHSLDRSDKTVISVLPKGVGKDEKTISMATIQSYGAVGGSLTHTNCPTNQESKKTQIYLYGTNLERDKTRIKLVDEQGVQWPLLTNPGNDSADFPIILANSVGIIGNGNCQYIEIILPNNIADIKLDNNEVSHPTFTYHFSTGSTDGSTNGINEHTYSYVFPSDCDNYDDEIKVTATVIPENQIGMRKRDKIKLTCKKIDEKGNILEKEEKIGYSWFPYEIEVDEIDGYTYQGLAKDSAELKGVFGNSNKEIVLVYKNNKAENPVEEPENPVEEEPEKPVEEPKNTDGIPVELDGKGESIDHKPEKPEEKPEINFVDINNHWAESYIKDLASKNYLWIDSSDRFEPNKYISRAELISSLYKVNEGLDLGLNKNKKIPYSDIEKEYYDAVEWAYSNNIIKGTGSNKFKPEDNLTREQLALVFARFLEELDIGASKEKPVKEFTDSNNISREAREAINMCVNKGLLEGKANGKFAPKDKLTRGEMAAVLSRFINLNK